MQFVYAGLTLSTVTLYMEPILAAHPELSRTAYALTITLNGGANAIVSIFYGRLVEKFGITCNCVCPGFFPSESNSPEAMEMLGPWINSRVPMGRAGVDGELDSTIIYLAADESSYVNGAIVSCDGGWTCC